MRMFESRSIAGVRRLAVFALVAKLRTWQPPFLREEPELRGEGRDCPEPARRRVNPAGGGRGLRVESPRAP